MVYAVWTLEEGEMVDYFHCQRLSFKWKKNSNFPSCAPTIKQLYKQLPNALMNNSFDILASTPNRQWHILFVWSLLCCSTWLGWVYKSSWVCFQWNSFILMLQLSLYMFITLLKLNFYAAKLPSHNDLHKKKRFTQKQHANIVWRSTVITILF